MRILIVDDDDATVDVIKDSVNWDRLGIDNVIYAYNVDGAKKHLREKTVDIVISDIEMPKETGIDLLRWVRQTNLECEFLLLTCHESFSYASEAISHEAAAYLTKPFDIDIMEMNLQKIVAKLTQNRSLKKSSEYGVWMEKNIRFMKRDFWKSILDYELAEEGRIREEIISRHIDIDYDRNYCIIFSKVSNILDDIDKYGKEVFEFTLEGFHSEILTGVVENEKVIKFHTSDALKYIAICEKENCESLKTRCNNLIDTCEKYFKSTITCCISKYYHMLELPKVKEQMEEMFYYNISYYGKTFLEEEVVLTKDSSIQIIDLELLVDFVNKKEKAKILRHLKNIFNELAGLKNLNVHTLYMIKQEIIQVVYAELIKYGIQATKLFHDDVSIKMEEHAVDSTVDMVRWVNYLLEKTFSYEEEIQKSATIIQKINQYIVDHYREDIGRNEIAAEFYLTPEYLAKLYKKKTEINLKDYINEYRIEKAKELLRKDTSNISNIAQMVGFDNFSYFSTLFKKSTGLSPKEYRNK